MAGGQAMAAVREMVRSMGAEQLDEAVAFATMELAGRDIPLEDVFRLCDEQELRRAKKSSMAEEVERIKSKLVGGEDGGRPSSDSSEETVVELLRALRSTPMTFETLEASRIGKTISGLRRKHSSEKVRGLAAALYKNWKAIVDEHLTRSCISKPPAPGTSKTASASDHAKKTDTAAGHKPAPAPSPRKTASNKHEAALAHANEAAKLAAAKRKLQDGYKEAASAKRQRVIQVIDTPKKVNRRPVAVVERRRITPGVATVAPLRMCRAV
uniref:TFIIS N-terminal domain-containing protein n=1 Tax=Oryza meridionalis TaxID=40149 RepID=A0A0E0EWA4_9ORYZ